MRLLEIVRGEQSSPSVIATSLALMLWIVRRESQTYERARRRQAKQRRKIHRQRKRDEGSSKPKDERG